MLLRSTVALLSALFVDGTWQLDEEEVPFIDSALRWFWKQNGISIKHDHHFLLKLSSVDFAGYINPSLTKDTFLHNKLKWSVLTVFHQSLWFSWCDFVFREFHWLKSCVPFLYLRYESNSFWKHVIFVKLFSQMVKNASNKRFANKQATFTDYITCLYVFFCRNRSNVFLKFAESYVEFLFIYLFL